CALPKQRGENPRPFSTDNVATRSTRFGFRDTLTRSQSYRGDAVRPPNAVRQQSCTALSRRALRKAAWVEPPPKIVVVTANPCLAENRKTGNAFHERIETAPSRRPSGTAC